MIDVVRGCCIWIFIFAGSVSWMLGMLNWNILRMIFQLLHMSGGASIGIYLLRVAFYNLSYE